MSDYPGNLRLVSEILGIPGTKFSWRKTLRRDPCSYCGKGFRIRTKKKRLPKNKTVDHIIPKGRGGHNVAENLTGSCSKCNNRKGDRPLLLFLLDCD